MEIGQIGAYDGERFSNTLALETRFNWTGLLIEADYDAFRILTTKNRHAHLLNACVERKNRMGFLWIFFSIQKILNPRNSRSIPEIVLNVNEPTIRRFSIYGAIGALVDGDRRVHGRARDRQVTCIPMGAVLAYLNWTHVDYLSANSFANSFNGNITNSWKITVGKNQETSRNCQNM